MSAGMTRRDAVITVRGLWGARAYAHCEGGWCRVGVVEPQGPLGHGNGLDERGCGRDYDRAIAQAIAQEKAAASRRAGSEEGKR